MGYNKNVVLVWRAFENCEGSFGSKIDNICIVMYESIWMKILLDIHGMDNIIALTSKDNIHNFDFCKENNNKVGEGDKWRL